LKRRRNYWEETVSGVDLGPEEGDDSRVPHVSERE
jgi:hypothetical protein